MKILVIDDEPLIRKGLQRALVRAGHQVVVAESGKQGVTYWLKGCADPHHCGEFYDAVLLDMIMPTMNATEVLREVHSSRGKEKVVIMSAFFGPPNKTPNGNTEDIRFSPYKVDLLLSKPFENIFEVVSIVEKLVMSHSTPTKAPPKINSL